MAILSDADVDAVLESLIRRWGDDLDRPQLNKAMARDLIRSLDQFLDDNAAKLNQAIPATSGGRPLRSEPTLTPAWKARVLVEVVSRRWEAS